VQFVLLKKKWSRQKATMLCAGLPKSPDPAGPTKGLPPPLLRAASRTVLDIGASNFEFDSSFEFRHSSFLSPPLKKTPGGARSTAWDRNKTLPASPAPFGARLFLCPPPCGRKRFPHSLDLRCPGSPTGRARLCTTRLPHGAETGDASGHLPRSSRPYPHVASFPDDRRRGWEGCYRIPSGC
jgi:hypothetical protein